MRDRVINQNSIGTLQMSQQQDRIEEVVKNFLDKKIDDHIESVANDRIEKKLSDIKWLISTVSGSFATIFAVLIVGAYINFYNEKSSLDTFKKDLEQKLTGRSGIPKITLLNVDRSSLNGSKVHVERIQLVSDPTGRIKKYQLIFPVQFRNDGSGIPKRVFVKMWISGPEQYLDEYLSVIDEEGKRRYVLYKTYSQNIQNSILDSLPQSTNFTDNFSIDVDKIPPKKEYDAKIKLIIGEEQSIVSESEFKIVFDEKTKFYDFSQPIQKKP